jgi:hypothetical protein
MGSNSKYGFILGFSRKSRNSLTTRRSELTHLPVKIEYSSPWPAAILNQVLSSMRPSKYRQACQSSVPTLGQELSDVFGQFRTLLPENGKTQYKPSMAPLGM